MEMYAFLLRPGLAALDNLADKFVAGWLLPSKVLDLSYPTPPLPLLVFATKINNTKMSRNSIMKIFDRIILF